MSGVNFGVEPCPWGSIVDGAAMAIGDTGDWCWVDAEVGDEDLSGNTGGSADTSEYPRECLE
jgi:hypothetical protein